MSNILLEHVDRRLPLHGRIRIGIKTKTRQGRESITTFRFTSPDELAIHAIADLYGATTGPRPWHDAKASPPDQFEVITPARAIRVWLPREQAISAWYELWSGGGCLRRCDGITAQLQSKDGWQDAPCPCAKRGHRECEIKLRLSVLLPEIRFGGVWRLDTSSKNALAELPGMTEVITTLQESAAGLIEASLELDEQVSKGGRERYVVPRLRMLVSPMEILSGEATPTMAAVGPGQNVTSTPALGTGIHEARVVGTHTPIEVSSRDTIDEIVDAELVPPAASEASTTAEAPGADPPPVRPQPADPASGVDPLPSRRRAANPAQAKLVIMCNELAAKREWDGEMLRHAIARKVSKGRKNRSTNLTVEERSEAIELLVAIEAGTIVALELLEAGPRLIIEEVK